MSNLDESGENIEEICAGSNNLSDLIVSVSDIESYNSNFRRTRESDDEDAINVQSWSSKYSN